MKFKTWEKVYWGIISFIFVPIWALVRWIVNRGDKE